MLITSLGYPLLTGTTATAVEQRLQAVVWNLLAAGSDASHSMVTQQRQQQWQRCLSGQGLPATVQPVHSECCYKCYYKCYSIARRRISPYASQRSYVQHSVFPW